MGQRYGGKIVTDGLILCLDAHDAKSYAGEPTTNLLGSNDNPLNGMSNITLTKIETQADGWIKYSMSGTFTGGTYPYMSYIDTVSFTGGTAYTSRAMIKTNVESKFNYFGSTGISYVNQPKDAEGTSRSVVTEENGLNVYTVSREGFIYTSTTSQRGYLYTNPINNTTFNSSTDFMWIKNVQVEQKTYPTPWTYTSRSATNGWKDRTTNNNHGTLTNMIGTGASHYRDGQVIMPVANSYLDFDGSDDYVTVSVTGTKTVEVWFNPDTTSGTNVLYGPYANGRDNWLDFSTTVRLLATESADTNNFTITGGSISTGNWYQAVAIIDGTTATLYLNGSQVATTTKTFTIGSWSGNADIGKRGALSQNYANAQIALVRVYNKALTAAEVLSNYNTTKGRFS